jgi:hypothetical protein
MKQFISLLCTVIILQLHAQSVSVFDANYFNMGNTAPLIEVGKGINITDVYKPTKHCFINATQLKLKPAQSGQKTTINYYYTKTEAQYNTLKNQGTSGQVSYLNLFSIGLSNNSSFSTKSNSTVERIVIEAKVDFGLYTLNGDPQLKPEAQALISKNKYSDFIDLYGTHYIYGVKKESSIWITLTKRATSEQSKSSTGSSFNSEFSPPAYGNFKIDASDDSEIQEALASENYEVSIELRGPAIKSEDLKNGISGIVNGTDDNKMNAISQLIQGALTNISDPNQAQITQYYYNPFTLYNLKVIQWNEKKQTRLININKNVLTLNATKIQLDKLVGPEGQMFVSSKFDKDISNFPNKTQYKNSYIQTYNEILPVVSAYKIEVDTTLKYLENIYNKCSNIYCSLDSSCSVVGPYEEKVAALNAKIKKDLFKLSKIKNEAWLAANKENNKPECEKESVGYVTVVNLSSNPYDFYSGDKYIERIAGKANLKYKLKPGTYNFKAQQVTGYMMYPTVNNRKVIVSQACTEATIKIGFED